jgi:uncharacterized membrane protein (UPF0127 family)
VADPQPSRFVGLETRTVLGRSVPVATGFRSRLLGLALLSRERAGPGLLIPDCSSVHTFGMRFELDVLFLDDGGRVISLRRSLPPARVARCATASAVLELPAPSVGESA